MASRDLSADLANYASKVQSGQTSQPTTKYNTPQKSEAYRSTRKTGTGTARVYGKPITSGRRKKDEEKDRNYLAETAVEGQSRNAAQQQAAAAEEQKQEQKPQTKYSDEANAKSGGQKQDQNKYSAEANATGPGKKSTSSKTSKPIEDPWDLAENRARVKAQIQKGHRAQAQAYLDEAAALQREGQTRTQIWEDGIYMGEDKQAAEEYSARIADLQAKAQAELDKAGKEEGFRGVKGAAKAVGVNLESGAWQGIMGAGLAGAAKVGQGVSSEDASTLYGRNAAQRSGDIAVNFANQLKNAWSGYTPGDKTLGGRTKDTIFSAFDAGSRAIDSGVLPGGDAAYHATNIFNYALRNWALPNITGSNDAKANAAWLTSKAYEATGKLTDKVAGLGGPLEYLNTEKLQAEMQKSDAAANLAGNTANVIGRMLPSIALSWATKNPKTGLSLMAASAGGSAAEEAYQRGATAEQAYQIGLEKGWVEYLTECMFSGIGLLGNGVLSEGLKGKLGDFMLTRLGMALGKAFDIGGENIEEAVSDWAGPGIDKAVLGYLPEGEEDISLVQAMMGQLPWTEQGLTTLLSTLVLGGFSDIAQNGMQRVSAEDAMEIVEIARNSGNEALANLAERYADLLDKKGSMGAKDYAEFVEATADRVGKEEMQRQLDEKRQRDENPGPTTMTMFSDPATGLNADQLALAKTPDSAAVDILKTNAASWLTAAITGTETGESILGDYISPEFIAQLPEGAQKAALAFANTQFAEEALQNIMNAAAEIVNGNPVDWDDSRSNAAAAYVLGTLSNLFQGGEQVDQKRQQAIAAEAVEFALSGMTIDEAIAAANQTAQKTLTATPLNVQIAPEGAQTQEGVNGPATAENAAEAGYNRVESKAEEPQKRTRKNRGKGTVSFEGATIGDWTYKAVDKSKLTQKQKSQISAVKTLAKATGVNIVFYETEAGEDGKLVGGNGAYHDGTIYLDVNAGLSEKLPDGRTVGQTAIVRTAAHELTHFIQDFAEEDYNKIKDYIVNKLVAERGVSGVEALIAEKMARDRTGKLTPEKALDEVMADGCEMMLKDTTAITDLFLSSPNLADKIRGWVNEWAQKVVDAFEGVDASHTEAKILMDSAEELQKMWDDALKNASEYKAPDSQNVKEQAFATLPGGTMKIPAEQYSLRSMRHDIQEGKMFEDLAKYTDMSADDIKNLRDGLTKVMDAISEHADILDMNETYGKEDRPFRPFKPNSDPLYTISLDHSTLCTKRLMTQYVIEKLQTTLVDSETGKLGRALTAEEQLAVRDLMKEYAKQEKALKVACAMCYVEAARLKAPSQINSFLRNPEKAMLRYFALKNKEFDASVKEAQAEFKESRGYPKNAKKGQMKNADVTALNKMSAKLRDAYGDANHPASAEERAAIEFAKTLPNETFLTAENLAKLAEGVTGGDVGKLVYKAYASIIRTATRSKALEADMPYYYGDSRAMVNGTEVVDDNFIRDISAENGMRFSSWSDWQVKHMLDMMTAVIELSTRHCSMHGYTKFLDQVRVFGKTGMMFNMSGVPQGTGLTEDGELDFSPSESVLVRLRPREQAKDGGEYDAILAREDFPETAGLQCIGISNEHIRALMASDLIDYIIPYHTSGLNATLRRMAQIANWDDFQPFQNAAIDSSIKFDKNIHDEETWHNEPVFSEFFNAAKDPANGYVEGEPGIDTMRRAADQYKKMCKERGLKPKFSWANSKVDADFTDDPNYWKLLIDRKMINQQNGELIEQKAVTPTFDYADILKIIQSEVKAYDPDLQDRALNYVKEHLDELPQRIADLKKSGTVKKAKADAKKSKELSRRFNELQAGVVAAATEGSLKMSERDNWNEGYRANVENSEALTQSVRDFLTEHGIAEDEIEEFGVNYNKAGKQNITDADNALAMVSEIAEGLTGKKQTEAFELMEGILRRMDPVERERYVAGDDPKSPAFAKWYNKKHPSLYYKGYKPGDLSWSRRPGRGQTEKDWHNKTDKAFYNNSREQVYLQNLIASGRLTAEDQADAQDFLNRLKDLNNDEVFYSERDYDAAVDGTHNGWSEEFYSKMDQTIEKQMPNKMGAHQVVGWLTGKGVKKEEIRWSGIEQFLEGKKTVTKQELQEFMAGNMVNIETKTLGEPGYKWVVPSLIDFEDEIEFDSLDDVNEAAKREAENLGLNPDTVFSFAQANGDYRWVGYSDDMEPITVATASERRVGTHWGQYTTRGGTNYREILFKMPGLEYENSASQAHWEDDAPGTIAHARVQDMETTDGKKVLFVDEIQSDLHNAGAKHGFAGSDYDARAIEFENKRVAALSRWNKILQDAEKITDYVHDSMIEKVARALPYGGMRRAEKIVDYNKVYDFVVGDSDSIVYQTSNIEEIILALEQFQNLIEEDKDLLSSIRTLRQDAKSSKDERYELRREAESKERSGVAPDVPFAGSANTYHEYIMKHLLRLAAEGDYDAIGWTTAEQQRRRWSDEFAEGYRIEYDQDIPSFMKKYTKQWGGKVGALLIAGEYNREWGPEGAPPTEVWGVELNDKMKNDVLYVGQPMFSERDAGQNDSDVTAANRADELGRQADEWVKEHGAPVTETGDTVDEKNWNRFWNATHKGYDALVNLIAKDAKNMKDYMSIFKTATGEEMSSDPDVLRKQLQDLVKDSSADSVTGKPLVSPEAINAPQAGYNGQETQPATVPTTQPAKNGTKLNWNAPGSSTPKTSQFYTNTKTKTGEAVDLEETDYRYVPITERESLRRAAAKVGRHPDEVLKDLYGNRIWLSEQVDAAYIIDGYLRSKALASGDDADWNAYKTFDKIVQERATEAGRSLQAFAKQSRPNAGSLLSTIEAEVDAIRRDADSRRSRWKVSAEDIAEVEKRGRELATKLAKIEQKYNDAIESGMNEKRAWNKVKNDYVKMASEIAAERMVGLIADIGKNKDLRNEVQRGVHETTTLLEKLLATRDADYIRKYVALSAAGITEDVKYKGKLTWDKASRYVNTLHKQGMLASVPTTLRNLEGNTVFGTVDWAANNVAGAAIDALFGHFTGERTRGMEWGVLDPRVAKAAKDAMIESVLEAAANIDLYDVPKDAKFGTAGQFSVNPYGNLGSRILLRAEQGLKYALESTDAFYVGASKASSSMAAARTNAKHGGTMTEKTAEAIGQNEAMFRTFKNVTPVQEFLQGLRGMLDIIGFGGEITRWGGTRIPIRKGGFGLGTFTVPFIGVPVNIAMKSAEYSPINIALGIYTANQMAQTFDEAKKKGDAELYQKALMLQNKAAGQMGRGVFGSILITLLMAAMKRAKKDDREIYKDWNLEENADVRAQNKAEGKTGQQVNVSLLMRCLFNPKWKDPGGWEKDDLAVNVSANEPMDQFLSMASMLADDDDAPDIMDLVEAAGKGTLDSIMDLSCVASVNEFINTMNYNPVYKTEEQEVNGETVEKEVIDKRATRHNAEAAMLAKSASGFIPAAIRHAAAVSDDFQRDTRGDTAVETALNQIVSNIPGKHGRESLPVKTDNFGNPIKTGDAGTRVANTYLANGYNRVNQSDVSAELERLREETGDVLLPSRNAPKTVTFGSGKDKKTVRLTADEGRDYHQTGGQDYQRSLRELFSSKDYINADTDTQDAMVKALKAFSNDTARSDLADDKNINYDSKYDAARATDHPTMSVSIRAGYNAAAKDENWDAVDQMTVAARNLTDKDREYLKKSQNFGFMYDMRQKGTNASKVNWYQNDIKERIAPTGKTQANGYEIFQTVVDGVASGNLTKLDADNFMNRQQSDGDYVVGKGRQSVYQAARNADYDPAEAFDIWETMDSNSNGKLTKTEVDAFFRKYKVDNAKQMKDEIYKANGLGKYAKKK